MNHEQTEPSMLRLRRARQVLAGRDDDGRPSHPSIYDEGVVSLASGNGVRRPHASTLRAAIRALFETEVVSLEKYAFMRPLPDFDGAVAASFEALGIDARNLCVASGSANLLCGFLYATTRPGDSILTGPSFYHALAECCHVFGVKLRCVPTRRENDYKITPEDLDLWYENASEEPKALVLFNPTYTGALYSTRELEALATVVAERGLLVLEDIIFAETRFERREPMGSMASIPEMRNRVVTISGASKAFSLANVRIGWACGPTRLTDGIRFFSGTSQGTVPHLSKLMATAALKAPAGYLDDNAEECRKRAALVAESTERVRERVRLALGFEPCVPLMEIDYHPSAGHSLLMSFEGTVGLKLPNSSVVRDSIDLTRYFLEEGKVGVSPGAAIGFETCKARLVYGSVGAAATYAQEREVVEVLKQLVEIGKRAGVDLQGRDSMRRDGDHRDSSAGFEEGRQVLREAVEGRLGHCLEALAVANREELRRRSVRGSGVVASGTATA